MNKRKKNIGDKEGEEKTPVTSNEKRLNKIKWIYQGEYKYENILKYDKNISECVVKCRQSETGVTTTGKAAEVVVVLAGIWAGSGWLAGVCQSSSPSLGTSVLSWSYLASQSVTRGGPLILKIFPDLAPKEVPHLEAVTD